MSWSLSASLLVRLLFNIIFLKELNDVIQKNTLQVHVYFCKPIKRSKQECQPFVSESKGFRHRLRLCETCLAWNNFLYTISSLVVKVNVGQSLSLKRRGNLNSAPRLRITLAPPSPRPQLKKILETRHTLPPPSHLHFLKIYKCLHEQTHTHTHDHLIEDLIFGSSVLEHWRHSSRDPRGLPKSRKLLAYSVVVFSNADLNWYHIMDWKRMCMEGAGE